MAKPPPKWVAALILAALIGGVWWFVEWRTAPPLPPKVQLPYAQP